MQYSMSQHPELNFMQWKDAAEQRSVSSVSVRRIDDEKATVTVDMQYPNATQTVQFTVYGSGDIMVDSTFKGTGRNLPMIPRMGTELVVAPGLENITWYGRGPMPTYVDRAFERIGVYHSKVDQEWVEYSRPQENGNKVDVRWVAITDENGVGLLAIGAPVMSVGAKHYTEQDIEDSDYSFKLSRRPEVYLNLDGMQMGVGGIDSWSPQALPMQPYRIPGSQTHSFRYRLTPVAGNVLEKAKARF
jgi:beta-galactosidase